jgi:hypothetical protein
MPLFWAEKPHRSTIGGVPVLCQTCCQTNSNRSLLGQYHCPLCRAKLAPLSKSSGAVGLEVVACEIVATKVRNVRTAVIRVMKLAAGATNVRFPGCGAACVSGQLRRPIRCDCKIGNREVSAPGSDLPLPILMGRASRLQFLNGRFRPNASNPALDLHRRDMFGVAIGKVCGLRIIFVMAYSL